MLRFLIDGMSYQSVIITWIVDVYTYIFAQCISKRNIQQLFGNKNKKAFTTQHKIV